MDEEHNRTAMQSEKKQIEWCALIVTDTRLKIAPGGSRRRMVKAARSGTKQCSWYALLSHWPIRKRARTARWTRSARVCRSRASGKSRRFIEVDNHEAVKIGNAKKNSEATKVLKPKAIYQNSAIREGVDELTLRESEAGALRSFINT